MLVAVAISGSLYSSWSAAADDIVIGLMCDRSGPTQTNGAIMCDAAQDYFRLVNSKGSVQGYKLRPIEVDAEYKVPLGIEAYERWKKEGAVSIMLYGTNHVQSLQQRMAEDKIPGTSPGFGTAASSGRSTLSLPLSDCGNILFASRGRCEIRRRQVRRSQRPEDRIPVLRQPHRS